jgi:hypothetical protein
LTACSLALPRDLGSPRGTKNAGTHGVAPFRAFPFARAVAPLGARNPHDVGGSGRRGGAAARITGRLRVAWSVRVSSSRLHGACGHPSSGCCTGAKSVAVSSASSTAVRARCSPGVEASAGPCANRTWDVCFHASSSHELPCRGLSTSRKKWCSPAPAALRSLAQSGGGCSSLRRSSTLLRFPTSSPVS